MLLVEKDIKWMNADGNNVYTHSAVYDCAYIICDITKYGLK